MFGWIFRSKPTCPVDSVTQEWIEDRMRWCIAEFGQTRLLAAPVIIPDHEYFPEPYYAREKDVEDAFRRVCRYLDVSPERVKLQFFKEALDAEHPHYNAGHSLGLYQHGSECSTIWVETSDIEDPLHVIATLAHELCHERLLGENRISATDLNHEPLTDLLTVFLGMGIFASSAVIRERKVWTRDYSYTNVSKRGYMTIPMFGYALAICAWWRREIAPQWVHHLTSEVRAYYRQGWDYLCSNENKSLQPLNCQK